MGCRLRAWGIASVALLAAATAFARPGAGEGVPAPVVLVLDASGSMWGQIEGRSKIDIARDVIRGLLRERDARTRLGLTVYGHRRESDCGDIESLVRLAPGNTPELLDALASIAPRGKTPLGAALDQAAEELAYREGPATVVLVSDGKETCGADTCAIARSLETRGVDFTAHVIGFAVDEAESADLRCVAHATGGLFVRAEDAEGLASAVRSVFAQASGRGDAGPGLWLAAALAVDRQPISEPVAWRISALAADGSLRGQPVLEAEKATLETLLPSGRYRVSARHRGVSGELDIDVDERARARHIVGLGAGRIELSAGYGQEDLPIYSELTWQLRRKGASEPGAPLAESSEASEVFVMPAGHYELIARYRDWTVRREIDLQLGQVRSEHVHFGRGQLALRAVLAEGRTPISDDLHWELRPLKLDSSSAEEKEHVEDRATCLFSLESGRYQVTASYGATRESQVVEVNAGVTQTYTLNLAAGEVRVFGSLPPPGGSLNEAVEWEVYRLARQSGDKAERVAREKGPNYSFILPAGRYRISGRLGKLRGDGLVELQPGESRPVDVVMR